MPPTPCSFPGKQIAHRLYISIFLPFPSGRAGDALPLRAAPRPRCLVAGKNFLEIARDLHVQGIPALICNLGLPGRKHGPRAGRPAGWAPRFPRHHPLCGHVGALSCRVPLLRPSRVLQEVTSAFTSPRRPCTGAPTRCGTWSCCPSPGSSTSSAPTAGSTAWPWSSRAGEAGTAGRPRAPRARFGALLAVPPRLPPGLCCHGRR